MRRSLYIAASIALTGALALAFNVPASAATICNIFNGCVGTSTAPAYGQLLIGGKNGEYEFAASSTLGSTAVGFSTTSAAFWLTQQSTSNLTEGSNLYFTNARAISALTGQSNSIFTNGAGYLTSLAGAASSTVLSDNNTFSGVDTFTNGSSNFAGTWQTFSPSHFQVAGTYVTSVGATWPVLSSGGTTPTLSWGGVSTSSNPSTGNLAFWTAANKITSIATSSLALTTGAFASPNVSQWTNDAGYVTSSFSTTSAAYWQTQNNYFSTTSAAYWESVNNFFSTTSASYFLSLNQGNAFSTTSANYWGGTKGYLTSLAGAASSTLLGDNNNFSGNDLFTNASSNFSGTWQTFSPSHFQTALGFTPVPNTRNVNTTYPLQGGGALSSDLTLSTAFGTTTANIWSQLQTFTSGLLSQASSTFSSQLNANNIVLPTVNSNNSIEWSAGGGLHSDGANLYLGGNGGIYFRPSGDSSGTNQSNFDSSGDLTVAGTLSAGTSTVKSLVITNIATSTANDGFNIAAGCYAVSGTCITQNSGTVTSVTGTYPVMSSGGATPAISLAFGTTTANAWSQLQILNGGASTTALTASGSEWVNGLTTLATTTVSTINNVIYVGGTNYPNTGSGVNAAIAVACAMGGNATIILPPGTTTTTANPGIQPNCANLTIKGAGRDSTVITGSSGHDLFDTNFTGDMHFSLEDLTLNASSTLTGVSNVQASFVSGGANYVSLSNVHIIGSGQTFTVFFAGPACVEGITGFIADALDCTNTFNTITNSVVEGGKNGVDMLSYSLQKDGGITDTIVRFGRAALYENRSDTFTGDTFADGVDQGVWATGPWMSNTFTGNTMEGMSSDGFRMTCGLGEPCTNNTIETNAGINLGGATISIGEFNGSSIGTTTGNTISGNTSFNTAYDVELRGASDNTIVNNPSASTTVGVYLDSNSNGNTVTLNQAQGDGTSVSDNGKNFTSNNPVVDSFGNAQGNTGNLSLQMQPPQSLTLTSSSTSGGNISDGTYYYEATALDGAGGETAPSVQLGPIVLGSPACSGSCSVTVSVGSSAAGAYSFKLYRATTSGVYGASSLVGTTTPNGSVSMTDVFATPVAGTPPLATTAKYFNIVNGAGSAAMWWLPGTPNRSWTGFGIGTSTSLSQAALWVDAFPGSAGSGALRVGDYFTNTGTTLLQIQQRWTGCGANGIAVAGNNGNSPTFTTEGCGQVDVGTTTGYARFTVAGKGSTTGTMVNFVNSASTSVANILDNGQAYFLGKLGIGTTTPGSLLSLAGTTGILASTTATSTFIGGGINLITGAGNTGCFAVNGICQQGIASASTTNTLWADVNRTDSYTANGTIIYPYKSVSSMLAGAWAGAPAYAFNLSPGTYVDGAPDTFPNVPFYLSGNESTLVEPSGVTFPNSFDIYDLTIVGNVHESDNNLATIHQFNNGVISGNLQMDGLGLEAYPVDSGSPRCSVHD